MTTIAERVAAIMVNDGQKFQAKDGRTLDQVAMEFGATKEGAISTPEGHLIPCSAYEAEHCNLGKVRYLFPDGSAIVVAFGEAWDVEGAEPFSWESEK